MSWSLEEAIAYYRTQGAPKDQTAMISLLKEIQKENQGSIPPYILGIVSESYNVKESFLHALIKRIPSLRLGNTHILELCAGRNCGKHTALAESAEKLHRACGQKFTLRFVPCMRMCAKGPNIKWDGVIYHNTDAALLQKLLKDAGIVF